jgi:hypothetical protein
VKTWSARLHGVVWTGVPDRVTNVLLNIPDGAPILHSEIGLLGFVTDNPIVDAFGLVDRRLSGATHEWPFDVLQSWAASPPPYLLMRKNVPLLESVTQTDWYIADRYTRQATWDTVWVDSPTPVTPLPPEQAFARLDRAIERVPREFAFHRARIALARETGDTAREQAACKALAADIPTLATYCSGAAAGQAAVPKGPLVPQSENAGFEDGPPGVATGWGTLTPDTPGWSVVTEGAFAGKRAILVNTPTWVCTDWLPMHGDVRVEGRIRYSGVVSDGNPRHGAAIAMRERRADHTFDTPTIQAWTGTSEWTAFSVTGKQGQDMVEYRACIGVNSTTGTAWFDDVVAGSG